MDEHDDDLEPEVSDGVEIETENYDEGADDDERRESEEGQPDVDIDDDEASDTI